jgi:hypothetical protein
VGNGLSDFIDEGTIIELSAPTAIGPVGLTGKTLSNI